MDAAPVGGCEDRLPWFAAGIDGLHPLERHPDEADPYAPMFSSEIGAASRRGCRRRRCLEATTSPEALALPTVQAARCRHGEPRLARWKEVVKQARWHRHPSAASRIVLHADTRVPASRPGAPVLKGACREKAKSRGDRSMTGGRLVDHRTVVPPCQGRTSA